MENSDNNRAARTLHKAQQDGVTASLAADGRIMLNGPADAKSKWGEAIAVLSYEELVGAVLGAFICNAVRTRYLDGKEHMLVGAISKATAAGIVAANTEVKLTEDDDE